MGRVMAPYGVHGWIKLRPYSEVPGALLDYRAWGLAVAEGGPWTQFAVIEAREHAQSVVAQLKGIDQRETAAAWKGALVGVPRSALPKLEPGEFLWSDLVGMIVVNRSAQVLGEVTGILDTGAHPVLRVRDEAAAAGNEERLIPFVSAYVDAIHAAERRIDVDWERDY